MDAYISKICVFRAFYVSFRQKSVVFIAKLTVSGSLFTLLFLLSHMCLVGKQREFADKVICISMKYNSRVSGIT